MARHIHTVPHGNNCESFRKKSAKFLRTQLGKHDRFLQNVARAIFPDKSVNLLRKKAKPKDWLRRRRDATLRNHHRVSDMGHPA